MTATTITAANLEDSEGGMYEDIWREIDAALQQGSEDHVEYERIPTSSTVIERVFFPRSGRGGVCEGGNTEWTDCTSLEDLADRWANYDDRWAN